MHQLITWLFYINYNTCKKKVELNQSFVQTQTKDVHWRLYILPIPLGWWLGEIFACKDRAFVNIVDVILFLYVCIRHWIPFIRNKSYMSMYHMSFSVRIFHNIILNPNICSVFSVALYWVTTSISMLHNCLLMKLAMITLYGRDCQKCMSM